MSVTKQQVIDLHRADPTLTAPDIAQALGTSASYVRATAQRCSLTLPRMPFQSMRDLRTALKRAEAFIAGFEDDATQDGIDGLLSDIRAALAGSGAAK
tara:strand:+ start:16842 stop:17135 length:294 start_codon:yes stop_codon:yes gene_type:complete